jgi:hypothetical protein
LFEVLKLVLLLLEVFAFVFLLFNNLLVLARAVFSLENGVISIHFCSVLLIIPPAHSFITQNKSAHLLSQAKSITSCLNLASFIKSIQVLSFIAKAIFLTSELVVVHFASLFIANSHLFHTSSKEALNALSKSAFNLISFAISSRIFA